MIRVRCYYNVAITVIKFRTTTVKMIRLMQVWYYCRDPSSHCHHRTQGPRTEVWRRLTATGAKNDQTTIELKNVMTRLTWWKEVVLGLSCKGSWSSHLVLNLLKEQFWQGFSLEWGFSLAVCLHLVSSSICCLTLLMMIRKHDSKEQIIIMKISQDNVIIREID